MICWILACEAMLDWKTALGHYDHALELKADFRETLLNRSNVLAQLLKLAPLGKSLYPVYIDRLKADGRDDLVVV